MKTRGFSLIEITIVLVILSIAAGAVALRIAPAMRRANMDELVREMGDFDRLTRLYARRHDRAVRIVLDTSVGQLRRIDPITLEQLGRAMDLPNGFAISSMRIRTGEVWGSAVGVHCSRNGMTPSYAMLLHGPGRREQWVMFAGLGGRLVTVDDTRELQKIMGCAAVRDDAD